MRELLRFLWLRPVLAVELLAASLLINLLGLASSLYVIQVLNRYVSSGVDATLITLTIGAVLAILMEGFLRHLRRDLANRVTNPPMGRVTAGFFNNLIGVRLAELLRLPTAGQRELLGHLSTVQKSYTPATVVAILDIPYAVLFIVALLLIHPVISAIATVFLISVYLLTLFAQHRFNKPIQEVTQLSAKHAALSAATLSAAETVRVFNAATLLRKSWWEQTVKLHLEQTRLIDRQEGLQSITQGISALMGVAVIGVGAKLAMLGQMDTGLIIGANILAGRAIAPLLRYAQLAPQLAKARQGLEMLAQFGKLPLEKGEGVSPQGFSGKVELQSIGFAWPGSKGVLFEALSLAIEPGKLIAVIGDNGTGKTTLLRLLAGALEPNRGKILVNGVNMAQLQPEWWHAQLTYLPQEPLFLEASLRENLVTVRSDLEEAALQELVDRVGLRRFLNESDQGLERPMTEAGQKLAPGIRRRIALARALAANGGLVLLDEPLEGMDAEGRKMILEWIKEWIAQGRTVVMASHDLNAAQIADVVVDLNVKPTPMIQFVTPRIPRIGGPE
ncbi:MAG: ATP-binding cassette domain-containing protein [Magnetococcales bacterium]|nr:ATP-binding cassette domain-containing protein [Magnetococcales bacterium]